MYKEITLTVILENETTQKFNAWLKNCFQKFDEHYRFAAINSGIVYRFQKLAINEEYTNAHIDPLYENETRMGKCIFLNWIEVGANLKVMITFPSDPRIVNPLWDILFELCNDFPYLRDTVPHLVREIKNEYQFEIPDIPLPVDAGQVGAAKPKKPNAQINQRAMIWRSLTGWMKLQQVTPTPKECIAELKKTKAYKNKKISTKRMQTILNEGFAGDYEDILKNI